jgi:hypothetical protein
VLDEYYYEDEGYKLKVNNDKERRNGRKRMIE